MPNEDTRRRAERIAAIRTMLNEWTNDEGKWLLTRRDALNFLADLDAEMAEAVAQAVKEREEKIKQTEASWRQLDEACAQQAEEIARLKLELSKTADLRDAWIEAQKNGADQQAQAVARLTESLRETKVDRDEANRCWQGAEAALAHLRTALRSIAANTCCNNCQEAALVAREALRAGGEQWDGIMSPMADDGEGM